MRQASVLSLALFPQIIWSPSQPNLKNVAFREARILLATPRYHSRPLSSPISASFWKSVSSEYFFRVSTLRLCEITFPLLFRDVFQDFLKTLELGLGAMSTWHDVVFLSLESANGSTEKSEL